MDVRSKTAAWTLACAALAATAAAGEAPGRRLAAVGGQELRDWDGRVDAMLRAGELRVRRTQEDTLLPSRTHVRLTQLHRGVPVYGGELVRQSDGSATVSVFGTLYDGIDLDPQPALTPDQAADVVEKLAGVDLGPERVPQLVVLPLEDGRFALTYTVRAFGKTLSRYFVDARTGALVLERDELVSQSAASGIGTGTAGDRKKMSVRRETAAYLADDVQRPPRLRTFDMKGNVNRTLAFLNGNTSLLEADIAQDADNTWTDAAVVDAHSYSGWTYDYYFKRHNRRGLDGNNLRILSLVHNVRREDFARYPDEIVDDFYLNAFYAGDGVMVYGEGLPTGVVLTTGQRVGFFSGGLDVVAHELTHGVTDYTSQLVYQGESGALNESFSDMMGASAEFYFSGTAPGTADWVLGEDVILPGGLRSMQNPLAFGDPDHYSIRFTGPQDNGGVHINSGIPNHVFYLAVVGGTHRLSGVAVQGVGQANIEQIERVMYRAFTTMMPPTANFSTARAVTIQSARDLFGAGSPAERAITQAWTAVGVN